ITGVGGGDITAVGDVSGGDAFTQAGTAGTSLWFHNSGFTGNLTVGTLSGSDKTFTLPDITGTFALLEGTQTFTGAKTFDDLTIADTNVALSGASSTFTAAGALTLTPGGANPITLSSDFDSSVFIGSATTPAPLSVSGGIGDNAAFVINQLNSGDLITASASGATKFSVANNGTITTSGDVKLLESGGSPSFYGTIDLADLGADRTYTIPEISTNGTFALLEGTQTFTGSKTLNDVVIADTNVSFSGLTTTLTPSGAFTIGSTSQSLTLRGSNTSLSETDSGFTTTLGFATPNSNKNITIPNADGTVAVSATGPITLSVVGDIACTTCVTSGGSNEGVLFHPSSYQVDLTTNPSIFINKLGAGNLLSLRQSSILGSNYTASDAAIFRSITGGAFDQSGSYISVTDDSSGTGLINPTGLLISINTPAATTLYTGNFIDLKSSDIAGGAPTSKFTVGPTGAVTQTGGLTFSGTIATDITNDTGDLTIVSGGAGVIDLNDGIKIPALAGTTATAVVCRATTGLLEGCSPNATGVTLQQAYDAGNTISTDLDGSDGNIDFTLANTATDRSFTITTADGATGFTSFIRENGGGSVDPAQLVLIDNADASRPQPIGLKVGSSGGGGVTTAIDLSDGTIGNALSLGANDITGTTYSLFATAGGLTLDASTDITLDAAGNDVVLAANGTTFATLTNSATDLTIDVAGGHFNLADADV